MQRCHRADRPRYELAGRRRASRSPTRAPLRIGGRSSSAGTPTPTSTARRWPRASHSPPREGATLVCLQELTLSPYFAITPDGPAAAAPSPRTLPGGPTHRVRRAQLAAETGVHVHASLYERADGGPTASATTPRSSSRPTASSSPAPASCTSRSPRATTRTTTSARARRDDDGLPGRRARRGAVRLPDVLGPVVPRARARLLARRRRGDRLPDRDRLRARPPGLRHRAAVGAGDRRPTGSPTARSWSRSTASGPRRR